MLPPPSFAGEMMSDGSVSTAIQPFSWRKKKFKQKNRYICFGEDDYACNPKFTSCLHSCLNSWQPMSVRLTVNVCKLSVFYVIIVVM